MHADRHDPNVTTSMGGPHMGKAGRDAGSGMILCRCGADSGCLFVSTEMKPFDDLIIDWEEVLAYHGGMMRYAFTIIYPDAAWLIGP